MEENKYPLMPPEEDPDQLDEPMLMPEVFPEDLQAYDASEEAPVLEQQLMDIPVSEPDYGELFAREIPESREEPVLEQQLMDIPVSEPDYGELFAREIPESREEPVVERELEQIPLHEPIPESHPSSLDDMSDHAVEALLDSLLAEDAGSEAVQEGVTDWYAQEEDPQAAAWAGPEQDAQAFMAPAAPVENHRQPESRPRGPRKGRPKRKKGYGFLGLPHLAATVVWLAIIVMIGTALGRMLWVAAADVLAFGRESRKVSITITSNDTIDDITEKLYEAGLIRYPAVFKFYAKIAVDDGDIIPGTFEMDTLYDYHALVVQMGPRSSNRAVVADVLIPEGLNCRQIFELLEQMNICTVKELEEYAASGEFSDFWFLEGVERGDKYCLEGFLFPDTYDFYANSTPREALGKMLLGFEARFTQELFDQLPVLNERLANMMRGKGCSEEWIEENRLTLRDLLTVASLIEEETASVKESPTIASVIFNRLTEDQMYERYLNIDAAIIYATGDPNNIDTSIDDPYNTYKYPGLTPGPISNPGLDSIMAALNFADTGYYYYVLNPETGMHQFSTTLAEHEQWVEQFRGMGE